MVKIAYGSAIGVLGLAMGAMLPVRADALLATDLPSSGGATLASASTTTELEPIVVTAQRLRLLLRQENEALDRSRDQNLLPKFGASTYNISQEAIEVLPQGKNTPLDKLLLQAPGVSYDSASATPIFTCATSTPTCSIGSTASSCRMGFRRWVRSWRLVLSAT